MINRSRLLARNLGVLRVSFMTQSVMNFSVKMNITYKHMFDLIFKNSVAIAENAFFASFAQPHPVYSLQVRQKSSTPLNTIIMFVPQQEVRISLISHVPINFANLRSFFLIKLHF